MPEPVPVDTKAIEEQARTCTVKSIASMMHFGNFTCKFSDSE